MSPFQMSKRRREDDEEEENERITKKTRNWSFQAHDRPQPLNLSPSSMFRLSRPCFPPSPPNQISPTNTGPHPLPQNIDEDSPLSPVDMFYTAPPSHDTDMTDDFDIIGSPPPHSPTLQVFRPPRLNAQLFAEPASHNNTGRIPTPIHAAFQAPRGPLLRTTSSYNVHPDTPTSQAPVIRKQTVTVERNRDWRMPSPISEDEDLPDTPTAFTQSQLERLSVDSNNNPSYENMDTDNANRNHDEDTPPTPIARKGRARSGAFTGKGRFSMGYREDCEKCRQRIPGHYSHFLPG